MRLLYLPLESPGSEDRGMARAFRALLGDANVAVLDYLASRDRLGRDPNVDLFRLVQDFKPDWVHGQYQDTLAIDPRVLATLRENEPNILFTHWTGDMRPAISGYMSAIARASHITFCSSVGQIQTWREAGAQDARYWQIAVDPEIDCAIDQPPRAYPFRVADVVFCGNYYPESFQKGSAQRLEMTQALKANFDFCIVGRGWPWGLNVVGMCGVKEQRDVYRQAKVSVGCNNFNEIELYYSDRQLCAMAAGTAHVCRYVPGLEQEFRDSIDCLFWRSPEGLVEKVRWLLEDANKREEVGRAGRATILARHTWEARIREILPLIEEKLAVLRA